MRLSVALVALGAQLLAVTAATAAPRPAAAEDTSPVFRALTTCRAITDDVRRLACYDDKVAVLQSAEVAGDIVVADRAQLRETGKALFGFGAIKLPIFGGHGDLETPSQLDAKIAGLRSLGYGKWEFRLDNGMRWLQTDPESIEPKVGQPVTIRSGVMGSFFIRVNGGHGVRAIRVQ